MTNGLEVISSGLFIANVRVNTCISGGTSQVLAVSEWNMLTIGRLVALGKTKIDDVNSVFILVIASYQEVIRLNVSMNNSFLVHYLNSLDHLHCNMEYSPQIELSAALLEQIFKTLAQKVHNHNVEHLAVLGLLITHEMEVRHCGFTSQLMDQL